MRPSNHQTTRFNANIMRDGTYIHQRWRGWHMFDTVSPRFCGREPGWGTRSVNLKNNWPNHYKYSTAKNHQQVCSCQAEAGGQWNVTSRQCLGLVMHFPNQEVPRNFWIARISYDLAQSALASITDVFLAYAYAKACRMTSLKNCGD